MRFADNKLRLIGAVILLQRLNLLICSLFALRRWNQMPLGALPRYVRVVVAASILSLRGSYYEALSKNTQKIQSGDGLARTSRAYAERPADEYRGQII